MKIRLKLDQEYHLIDPKFYNKKGRYLFQSLLAALAPVSYTHLRAHET